MHANMVVKQERVDVNKKQNKKNKQKNHEAVLEHNDWLGLHDNQPLTSITCRIVRLTP